MGLGFSPRDGAWEGLARYLMLWTAGTRMLYSGEHWRRWQSMREGERGRNEVGERAGAGRAQKGARACGQAMWSGFSACVCPG
jgi:hypothetical protein